jgi:hypothetical protein
MVVNEIEIRGFKDQNRKLVLSGLDVFTSNQVNGVGKSAVLECFKLGLLGILPGQAETLEDLFRYTTGDAMAVVLSAATEQGLVRVERNFLRNAIAGEKRPICINGHVLRFEEGDRRARELLGAVSISFDPGEFLNLSRTKKREWILAHSPEAHCWNRQGVQLSLLAGLARLQFGASWLGSACDRFHAATAAEILNCCGDEHLLEVWQLLSAAVAREDAQRERSWRRLIDLAFAAWSDTAPAEMNLAALVGRLKSEAQALKCALEEHAAAVACARSYASPAAVGETDVETCRESIARLRRNLAEMRARTQERIRPVRERQERRGRLETVERELAAIRERTASDQTVTLRQRLNDLRGRWDADNPKLESIEAAEAERTQCEAVVLQSRTRRADLQRVLEMKCGKRDELNHEALRCPIAPEVRCNTDFAPHREMLERDVARLAAESATATEENARAEQSLMSLQNTVKQLRAARQQTLRSNQELQRQIEEAGNVLVTEERAQAEARGRLQSLAEEHERLVRSVADISRDGGDDMSAESLKRERELESRLQQEEAHLEKLLRERGRAEAVARWALRRDQLRTDCDTAKRLVELTRGLTATLAQRIGAAIESEMNDLLQSADADWRLRIDLSSGKECLIGRQSSDGKVIPLETLNSAHFVLFLAPFLTVLVNRLARMRRKAGRNTLRALCIEAEALAPDNVVLLLKSLSALKERGLLDNVLVAHYNSLWGSEKWHGFVETVLTQQHAEQDERNLMGAAL